MKQHLNTLFVTTQGAFLVKKGEAVVVRVEKKERLRVPFINLGSIACFGRVGCSTPLLGACAEHGIAVSLLTEQGRFLAAVNGFTPGNVLLRREQYRRADEADGSAEIARACVIGKLANYRTVLRRAAREHADAEAAEALTRVAKRIDQTVQSLAKPVALDPLRGVEGEASSNYFGVFNHLITAQKDGFQFTSRSRRPPLDAVNALLSFLYSMLAHDARSACEATGLDAAVGFLHRDRPGRPGLALDLMEELRPVLADRVALSLINRQQVKASGFTVEPTGGVLMDDATRRTVIATYQKRKQETVLHPFLNEKITVGLIVHIQARLLARHLRGDLDAYPPFAWK
ncbi:MAG: type I-C CRISPR-associated endonuclease Cas1 [Planctomycetales bacterium]|nr:type I-C CRISPR-associated endonuclease Cas1 [Planctomycetales bacterium]